MKTNQQTASRNEQRDKAIELKAQGWKQSHIAEYLGVQPSTVSRWLRTEQKITLAEGQKDRAARGVSTKLTPEQLQELLFLLAKGPGAFGLSDSLWTRQTVCLLIEQTFGLKVGLDSVSVIMQKTGWQLNPRVTRLQISELKQQGQQPEEIAQQLGVPLALVQQWFGSGIIRGHNTKAAIRNTWVNSKLDAEQLETLTKLLLKPPSDYGLAAKSWTRKAICDLILQTYGVSFSVNHIPHLLRRIRRMMYTAR